MILLKLMLLHLQQLFHPNDPACLKENYAKARQKMTNMPRLLAELQQSVRERGQMPGWIEDFITPVENIKKSEDVKEESEEFEKDCGDEELEEERNPSEKEKVNEAGDLNGDGDQELEEERNASEKEKVNETGNLDGNGDEELEEERNASEKEKVNEAGNLDGNGDQELEEEINASEKEKVNKQTLNTF